MLRWQIDAYQHMSSGFLQGIANCHNAMGSAVEPSPLRVVSEP
jgi:hypothetical protein